MQKKMTFTLKWRQTSENNWLIFRLRGYLALLQWISANSSDPEIIGDTNVALDETETLIDTLKHKRRFK
jgi:hypothetical protein